MDSVEERYRILKDSLPKDVKLIAVSKTWPVEDIKEVFDLGQRVFGENKIQELREKIEQLPSDIEWHFIGNLQTNKVKYLDERVALVQSLDRISLLNELDKNAKKKNYIQKVLLEINIGREESKGGILIENLNDLIKEAKLKENICVMGLMAVIPKTSADEQDKYFKQMKEIFDELKQKETHNFKMEILSMGMSGDYESAIKNGSNMIRLGKSIFGERKYPPKSN